MENGINGIINHLAILFGNRLGLVLSGKTANSVQTTVRTRSGNVVDLGIKQKKEMGDFMEPTHVLTHRDR
jgi:uncharacterized membrane protein YqgA involved in biofilm formation